MWRMDEFGLQPLRVPSGWIASYNQLTELDPDPTAVDPNSALMYFKEDLLQFTSPGRNRLVDIGWYPTGDLINGEYGLVVHEGDFRGRLLHRYHTRSRHELVRELERVLMEDRVR
jgi:hypothetical protein